METIRSIATTDAPAAIGPYSQAVVAGGLVHCSGQIALDPRSAVIVGADAAAQAERVFANLDAVLRAAGSSLARALKCTVYLKDMNDFAAVNEVYARWLSAAPEPPARATVQVARLPKDALVEIDCVALA